MKNLLIICDAFPPAFAPRMGGLCKYIQELGWNVYVLAENQQSVGNISDVNSKKVVLLDYYKTGSKLEWLIKFPLDFLFHHKDKCMIKLFRHSYPDVNFNAILCSTYMLFPMYAAYKIAEELKVPLVYDMRDLLEQLAEEASELSQAALKQIAKATGVTQKSLLEAAEKFYDGVVFVPFATAGATDARQYENICDTCLRFSPFMAPESDTKAGVHGTDERISVRSYAQGIRVLIELMQLACM